MNLNKNKLMSRKINQVSNNNINNIRSYLSNSRNNIYNIQENKIHYNSVNNINDKKYLTIKNVKPNNHYVIKNKHFNTKINQPSSILTNIKHYNELNLNKIYNYNILGEINNNFLQSKNN